MTSITPADFPTHLGVVRQLFRHYVDSLGIDLSFQDVEHELAALPGKYAHPHGCVLLAWVDGQPVGCVALRPIDTVSCEMKRLFVLPAYRSHRLGRQLALALLDQARQRGYRHICLDTLSTMAPAIRLYTDLGFRSIPPYVYNPIEGAIYLGRDL